MAFSDTTASTNTSTVTYSNGSGGVNTTATSSAAPTSSNPTQQQRRRIIKAAPPKVDPAAAATNNPVVVSGSHNNNKVRGGDDDDDYDNSTKKHSTRKHHEPSVALQDVEESTQEWREERLKAAQSRGKALREKELAQRRKMETSKSADASANPFSRFLSVFSVEPKHPEHKRSFEGTPDDDDELKGPVEKRRRSCDAADPKDNVGRPSSSSSSTKGVLSSKWFWVSTVAAVAVGVAVAFHRGAGGRKK